MKACRRERPLPEHRLAYKLAHPNAAATNRRCARFQRRLSGARKLVLVRLSAQAAICAVNAGGTVTSPDFSAVQSAILGGGTVRLAFNGTVAFTNTLTILKDTTVDGTGYSVRLDGGYA